MQTAYKTLAPMACLPLSLRFIGPVVAVGALAGLLGGCPFSSNGGSGGAGGAGGASAATMMTPINRWYVTCGVPGCPADSPVTAAPCNSDEHEGAACDYLGAKCDNRLPCGEVVECLASDPKAAGCF